MAPSPRWVGRVVMRRSIRRSSTLTLDSTVLGKALLGDVQVAHDLDPRDDPGDHPLRDARRLVQHAVDPEAHAHVALVGLEVDVGGALGDRLAEDAVDELDDGGVLGRLAQLDQLRLVDALLLLGLVDRLADRALKRVEAPDQRVDVLLGGHRDAAVEPGRHLDVVERQHVRRVGHREQQRLLVRVADGQRLVAARRARPRAGSPPPCRPGRRTGRCARGRSARRSRARAARR